MDFVDRGDDRPEPISIARCRELLGDEPSNAATSCQNDVHAVTGPAVIESRSDTPMPVRYVSDVMEAFQCLAFWFLTVQVRVGAW